MIDFRKTLENSCFCLDLKSTAKEGIIIEMVDALFLAGKLKDRDAALQSVMDRERRMSTGMQHGVAVPHGKTASVDHLVTALGIKPEGIEFDALDKLPARIFVMTLSPVNRTGPHIQYLAEISRFLNDPAIRDRLIQARTREDVLAVLSD